jgi:2,3-bisphosphoglycerate-independent phosphoglycerate mutase
VKYLIVIPEGCADDALSDLDDQTPLAVAPTPHLDRLAESGRLGTVSTVPGGLLPMDDVTLMSVLGYEPREHPAGFAPLEAKGVDMASDDLPAHAWMLRISLVSATNGVLTDHQCAAAVSAESAAGDGTIADAKPSARGGVSRAEAERLLHDLHEAMRVQHPEIAHEWRFVPGRAHRALLIDRSNRSYRETVLHPAPLLLDQPLHRHRPSGAHHALLRDLILTSESVFLEHEVNQLRIELGERPITHAWPWGAGPLEAWSYFRPFSERYDQLRGAMITANDLAAGIAALIGWEVVRLDDEYHPQQIVDRAKDALATFDLVCVYLTETDRLSHVGDASAKVAALADLDRWVIGPLAEAIGSYNHWRMMVLPTHVTSSATGRHESRPVPCVFAGELFGSVREAPFTELDAAEADLHVGVGSELMEYLLFGAGIGRRHDD